MTSYIAPSLNELLYKEHPNVVRIKTDQGSIISPIQPTIFGNSIDFGSVVSISDAYHIDRMGSGGHFVEFSIRFNTQVNNSESYMTFSRSIQSKWKEITKEEYDKHPTWPNTSYGGIYPYQTTYYDTDEAVSQMQKIVDHWIKLWTDIKMQTYKS
jgi:hypothetical protein